MSINNFEDSLIFMVDFNDQDNAGRLKASRSFASSKRQPSIGEIVVARDDEGGECSGAVAAVDGLIVYINLDKSTWRKFTIHTKKTHHD